MGFVDLEAGTRQVVNSSCFSEDTGVEVSFLKKEGKDLLNSENAFAKEFAISVFKFVRRLTDLKFHEESFKIFEERGLKKEAIFA